MPKLPSGDGREREEDGIKGPVLSLTTSNYSSKENTREGTQTKEIHKTKGTLPETEWRPR